MMRQTISLAVTNRTIGCHAGDDKVPGLFLTMAGRQSSELQSSSRRQRSDRKYQPYHPYQQHPSARRGFTLLELLLALAIVLLLMGSLWQTLQLTARFEQGPSADETAGLLVRGLMQELQRDLQSLRAPSPAITTGLSDLDSLDRLPQSQAAITSTVDKALMSPSRQLIGDPHGFTMLRPTADQRWELVSYRTPLSPQRIEFRWSNRGSSVPMSATLKAVPQGLHRDVRRLSTAGELLPFSPPDSDAISSHAARASHVEHPWQIPEVRSLRCRYFDGASWLTDWSSGENASVLPKAIELEVTCIGSTPQRIVLTLANDDRTDRTIDAGVTP